tara:strand:- start:383 stop:1375 length:993 start_codon:yes stop_codon:yes gene_type:complete
MLIVRTPLRISLFGGGTDYPLWFREYGGSVISSSINRYNYITSRWLPQFFEYKYRIRYYLKEEVSDINDIKHPSVKACAKFLNISDGFEVVHCSDLPAQTGLGSSSSFTVGMLHSFYSLLSKTPTKRELAVNAINVEQNIIQESVGSQDQVVAAFGGFNRIDFKKDENFEVTPIVISQNRLKELEENLLLCFTGLSRSASSLAELQIKNTPSKYQELKKIHDITEEAFKVITTEKSLDQIGYLLNEHWKLKSSLTNKISNGFIDKIYNTAISNGALGGKLLGAGGGGFMLFYAKKDQHDRIKNSLKEFIFVPMKFEFSGSKVVYFSHSNE